MSKTHFMEAAEACIANGERLLDDVNWMIWEERPSATCFVLATIAQEEFAKAFFLFLADRAVIPWNSFVARATRDHSCKQLLGLVIDFLSPEWEEESRRSSEFLANIDEHKRLIATYKASTDKDERDKIWERIEEISAEFDCVPQAVTDAIIILRHEKIGRWLSSAWVWEQKPTYDPLAQRLADGKLDREKQDALYVRLGRDGRVASTPNIKYEDAKAAMELGKRMRWFVKYALEQGDGPCREYTTIESAFKAAFASLTEDIQSLAS